LSIFSGLVQKAAALVVAGLATQICRAILGGAKLRSEDTITIDRSVDRVNAESSIFFPGICHVHSDSLVGRAGFGFADDNFLDLAILTKVVGTA
jgi:hypothetical protein